MHSHIYKRIDWSLMKRVIRSVEICKDTYWMKKLWKEIQKRKISLLNWVKLGEQWLANGVAWNLFPALAAMLLNWVGGIQFSFMDFVKDYTLIVFSITIGLIGVAHEKEKKVTWIYFMAAFCLVLRFGLFTDLISEESMESIDIKKLHVIFVLITFFLIVDIKVGVKINSTSTQNENNGISEFEDVNIKECEKNERKKE